jgi:hypothetical protein
MIRKLYRAVGTLLILGFLTPSLATAADQTTVAAVTPATTVATAATATTPTTVTPADATDVAQAGPLSDVPLNSWAYDAVDQLAKDGIIKGYPDGTYKGNRPMTRYEVAVLAYRAVDMLEAQITAGKSTVSKADLDAANKLIAAFGNELKAVERHVDALQQEADATQQAVRGQAGQIQALTDFDKKAYIKYTGIMTDFTYGGNVEYNCGLQGPYAAGLAGTAAYCHNTGPGNALLQGVTPGQFQPNLGNTPPSGRFPNGNHNQGVAFYYQKISFTGTPSPNTSFLVEMGNSARPSQDTGTTTDTSAYCTPEENYLNGNASIPVNANGCTTSAAGAADFNNGETGYLFSANNTWIQLQNPNTGWYFRTGHVQVNEGPTGGSWLGGDYFWGAFLGITKGPFNAYVGYGFDNSAATNLSLLGIPYPSQNFVAEADYSFNLSRLNINIAGMYSNYTGQSSSNWDPSAVLCTGALGAAKYFANTQSSPFTTCPAGYTTTTYATGTPIEGYYLSPQANNPTYPTTSTGILPSGGASNTTPGLVLENPISMLAGHIILTYNKVRLYLAGQYHLGNDPYTGSPWVGALNGDFVLDIGPWRAGGLTGADHNHGKWTYEAQGFAVQFNGATPNTNYFGGPILDNSWTTNYNGLYWVEAAVKYWVSDNVFAAIGYGHTGLLSNTILPASTAACPGCVLSGFSQNAGFLQINMSF